ncbi:hypothetical protein BSF38_02847 [Paludisphaera borealis]|uniref:Uncharacterized protein n=1 Tax=Paludisphaera borealis TaxID=1387353 RepID=A0A1U7CR33_9BACT|nr:hypothetical protein BSF38_02847 [Paludisphaera borealis]
MRWGHSGRFAISLTTSVPESRPPREVGFVRAENPRRRRPKPLPVPPRRPGSTRPDEPPVVPAEFGFVRSTKPGRTRNINPLSTTHSSQQHDWLRLPGKPTVAPRVATSKSFASPVVDGRSWASNGPLPPAGQLGPFGAFSWPAFGFVPPVRHSLSSRIVKEPGEAGPPLPLLLSTIAKSETVYATICSYSERPECKPPWRRGDNRPHENGVRGRPGPVGAPLVGARFVSRRPLTLGDRAPTRGAPTANHRPGFSERLEAPACGWLMRPVPVLICTSETECYISDGVLRPTPTTPTS